MRGYFGQVDPQELAERAVKAKQDAPPGHSGIGTTLTGNITDALATALPLLPRARWPVLAARYGVQVIEGPPPDTR